MSEQKQEPRQLAEIQKEYNELMSKLGQARYQVFVIERDIAALNSRSLEINQEAAARNELDKATPAKEVQAEVVNA